MVYFFTKLLTKCTWWFFVFLSVWLFGNNVYGDEILFIRLINYFTPWILFITLILFCFTVFLKLYFRAFLFGATLLIISVPYMKYFWSNESYQDLSHKKSLTVLTFSVMGRNKHFEDIARVIKDHVADVIFLQEVSDFPALLSQLKELYGYETPIYFIDGFMPIISRYPLIKIFSNSSLTTAETYIGNQKHCLFNIHATKSITGGKMYDLQKKTITTVIEDSKSLEYPVIVAGDFNSTEMSAIYRRMVKHFKNSHDDAGSGFGFTFPSPERNIGSFFKFIRIDHIFYNRFYTAIDSYTVSENGRSDHYPVFATLININE